MASIYSISASRRLAWPRRSLRQRQAGLQGPVEVFASIKQACRALSNTSPASSRLAWPRRSLRQRQAGLHGLIEVFASVKQACRAPSNTSPASSRLAGPCRSLRQRQTGMAFVSRGAIGEAVSRGDEKEDWAQESIFVHASNQRRNRFMNNSIYRFPNPGNEPVKTYAPGTSDKAALKKALLQLSAEEWTSRW